MDAIAAMARNRVIGNNDSLPWNIPEDMEWFHSQTDGQLLVMGRKTYESIKTKKDNTTYVILTRDKNYTSSNKNVIILHNLSDLDSICVDNQLVWLCGGAEVYQALLQECEYLYLTELKDMYEGDTVFPPFENQFSLEEIVHETALFAIKKYVNNRMSTT